MFLLRDVLDVINFDKHELQYCQSYNLHFNSVHKKRVIAKATCNIINVFCIVCGKPICFPKFIASTIKHFPHKIYVHATLVHRHW